MRPIKGVIEELSGGRSRLSYPDGMTLELDAGQVERLRSVKSKGTLRNMEGRGSMCSMALTVSANEVAGMAARSSGTTIQALVNDAVTAYIPLIEGLDVPRTEGKPATSIRLPASTIMVLKETCKARGLLMRDVVSHTVELYAKEVVNGESANV
ncbi:MAG: hypothetical protein WC683_03890 [bacterium]